MDVEFISIRGHRATLQESPRGYVTISCPGAETIQESMTEETHDRIVALGSKEHVRPWQEEMARLRERVIARARREWKHLGHRGDP